MVALAEVAEISGGITKNAKRSALAIQRPYLSVANVHFNRIDISNLSNIGVNEAEIARAQLMPGDLMVVEGNGSLSQLGRVAIWHGQVSGCLHQNHLIKVRPKPTVKSKWLLYWLMSSAGREAIEATASSTSGLHTLSLAKVGSLPAPIASLEEQEAAIAYIDLHLSRLDEAVFTLQGIQAKLKQARASILKAAVEGRLVETEAELASLEDRRFQAGGSLLDEALESRVISGKLISRSIDMASCAKVIRSIPQRWRAAPLGKVASDCLIGLDRSRARQHSDPTGIPYIRMQDLGPNGHIRIDALVCVDATASEQKKFQIRGGDILFNTRNSLELVGKVGIAPASAHGFLYNNNLMRIRFGGALNPQFACYQMCSPQFRKHLDTVKKATTSVAAIYAKDLFPLPILIPPLDEQTRIVAEVNCRFSVLDQVEATVQASLARCGMLRQAILKRAFVG